MIYTPRLPPMAHQVTGRAKLAARPRPRGLDAFAWLHEMGCGKTYQALWEWGEQATGGGTTDLLVVAPAGSYRNWWVDTPERPSELSRYLDPALLDCTLVQGWVSGMGVTATRALGKFLDNKKGQPRAFFVNVESLSSVEKAREAVTQFLIPGRAMMIIDESTRIRNHESKRTDWIVRAGSRAAARRIMTGLPTPRSPLDLYSQFEFLHPDILGFRDQFSFRRRYAVMKETVVGYKRDDLGRPKTDKTIGKLKLRKAWVDVGYRNEEELRDKIAPYSYRVLKSECLDIAPKLYLPPRVVELTREQERIYREMTSQATTELDSGEYVSADRRIDQIAKLHHVVQGFVRTDSKIVQRIKNNRVPALLEALDEASGKVIIWVSYTESLLEVTEELKREFGESSVAQFWGGNIKTRHEDEARYAGDPACRFKVATPGAGGVGNTWVEGQLAVYFSGTPDLEHRLQSEDRTHRIGQKGQAMYLDLYVPGTVDERIMEINRKKLDMATALLGEGYREWLRWK